MFRLTQCCVNNRCHSFCGCSRPQVSIFAISKHTPLDHLHFYSESGKELRAKVPSASLTEEATGPLEFGGIDKYESHMGDEYSFTPSI